MKRLRQLRQDTSSTDPSEEKLSADERLLFVVFVRIFHSGYMFVLIFANSLTSFYETNTDADIYAIIIISPVVQEKSICLEEEKHSS